MKQIILTLFSVMILVLSLLIILSLQQRSIRQTKLANGLNDLLEEYMEGAMMNEEFRTQTNQEFSSWFLDKLDQRISEEATYDISVKNRDISGGIVAVDVKESFVNVNGDSGDLSYQNAVIVEQEEMPKTGCVQYEIPEEVANEYQYPVILKTYTIEVGSNLKSPQVIQIPGKSFVGWWDEKEDVIYKESEIKDQVMKFEDRRFVAVYQ